MRPYSMRFPLVQVCHEHLQERDGTTCICSTSSKLTLLSCSGIGRQTAAALAKGNAIGKEEEIIDSTATQACCGTGCCVTWLVNLKISQCRTVNQPDYSTAMQWCWRAAMQSVVQSCSSR